MSNWHFLFFIKEYPSTAIPVPIQWMGIRIRPGNIILDCLDLPSQTIKNGAINFASHIAITLNTSSVNIIEGLTNEVLVIVAMINRITPCQSIFPTVLVRIPCPIERIGATLSNIILDSLDPLPRRVVNNVSYFAPIVAGGL